jgi:hypothetical protein
MNALQRAALKQELLAYLIANFEDVKTEYLFHHKRKFKFDYALPTEMIAVEVNGGQWTNGRHTRGGKGYENDLKKLNLAQMNGWRVLQYTYEMLETLEYKVNLDSI